MTRSPEPRHSRHALPPRRWSCCCESLFLPSPPTSPPPTDLHGRMKKKNTTTRRLLRFASRLTWRYAAAAPNCATGLRALLAAYIVDVVSLLLRVGSRTYNDDRATPRKQRGEECQTKLREGKRRDHQAPSASDARLWASAAAKFLFIRSPSAQARPHLPHNTSRHGIHERRPPIPPPGRHRRRARGRRRPRADRRPRARDRRRRVPCAGERNMTRGLNQMMGG